MALLSHEPLSPLSTAAAAAAAETLNILGQQFSTSSVPKSTVESIVRNLSAKWEAQILVNYSMCL